MLVRRLTPCRAWPRRLNRFMYQNLCLINAKVVKFIETAKSFYINIYLLTPFWRNIFISVTIIKCLINNYNM